MKRQWYYSQRVHYALYYKFGEYQTIIELLRALFPDGEDKLPKLREDYLAWTLNSLGVSYSISGQSRWAKPLFKKQITLREKRGEKKNLVTGLGNLAGDQILTGELDAAESNLRRVIEIGRGIKDVFEEAVGHRDLGLLLTYRGKFEESENELISALELLTKSDFAQSQCVLWTYHSNRALLMSNADEVLKYALKACELVDVQPHVRDIIRVEYFLGAAHIMKGNFVEAEQHLTEALTRNRKINLVELEPDILLEFAKLRFQENHKGEALKFAEESLLIADRCEYRLKRAECGYTPALEKAEEMLNEIEQR